MCCYKGKQFDFFKRIGAKFRIKERTLKIQYPVKYRNGDFEWHTIMHDTDIQESMKIFYCQAEEMSEVLVIQDKMKPAREKCPIEVKGEDISRHHVNLGYYQLLSSTPEIAEHYIRKLEYIQLVMGT